MKFQTLIPHKAGSLLYVNGRTIRIDAYGCVDVESSADIETFKGMPNEWSSKIQPVVPVAGALTPETVQPKTAADLVRAIQTDEMLRQRLAGMRSAITRRSWLESQGYRFTDEELERAMPAAPQPAPVQTPSAPPAAVQTPPPAAPPAPPPAVTPPKGKRGAKKGGG